MMRRTWRVSDPMGDVLFMPRNELRPSGLSRGHLLASPATLRELNASLGGTSGDSAERAADRVMEAVNAGALVVLRQPPSRMRIAPSDDGKAPPAWDSEPPPALAQIKVSLFDCEGNARAVGGVRCVVQTPANETVTRTFDGTSSPIDVEGIPAGSCRVTFPNLDPNATSDDKRPPPPPDPRVPEEAKMRDLPGAQKIGRADASTAFELPTRAAPHVFQLQRRSTEVIELEHFREGGAIFLPDLPPGDVALRDGAPRVRGIDALRACAQAAAEIPVEQLLVAGHAQAEVAHGGFSKARAENVAALLAADRDRWVAVCTSRGTDDDARAILHWLAIDRAFAWPCEPGAGSLEPALRAFQTRYNAAFRADTAVSGALTPPTWGAFFDCYMRALRPEQQPQEPVYPIGDEKTRTGRNAGRPQDKTPFIVVGTSGPGNAPITIAKIATGHESDYTQLEPLNPQYRFGVDPEWIGQTLNVPWEWAHKLEAAGYVVEQDPNARDPHAPPPAPPGPPPLKRFPAAYGCGMHHVRSPHDRAADRRAVQRHVEVIFFEKTTDIPRAGLVCKEEDPGPCTVSTCALYDPREYELEYIPVAPVAAPELVPVVFRIVEENGRPRPSMRLTIRRPDSSLLQAMTDERGEVRLLGRQGEVFRLLGATDADSTAVLHVVGTSPVEV